MSITDLKRLADAVNIKCVVAENERTK
jgi:hypothetical protein